MADEATIVKFLAYPNSRRRCDRCGKWMVMRFACCVPLSRINGYSWRGEYYWWCQCGRIGRAMEDSWIAARMADVAQEYRAAWRMANPGPWKRLLAWRKRNEAHLRYRAWLLVTIWHWLRR